MIEESGAMRRRTGLIAWKTTITRLILLSSMALNSADAAANNTDHEVPTLLALIAPLDNQPEITQPPEAAVRSLSWQRYPELAKLLPLLVAEPLPSAKLSQTPRSRGRSQSDSRTSRPEPGTSPPRASYRQLRFFSRVRTLLSSRLTRQLVVAQLCE